MQYKVIVKHPQYVVWQDEPSGELLYTGVLGDHAMAPKTFLMSIDEVQEFKAEGEQYLAKLRMQMEREFGSEFWNSRFIKGFEKQPGVLEIIEDRSYTPLKTAGFLSKIFGSK